MSHPEIDKLKGECYYCRKCTPWCGKEARAQRRICFFLGLLIGVMAIPMAMSWILWILM